MQIQKNKVAKLNPQMKLHNLYVKQSIKNTQCDNTAPLYSLMPGINNIRQSINTILITALLNSNVHVCRNVLIRGKFGIGKSFLLQAISKEYGFTIIKSKASQLSENIQKAKMFKNSFLVVNDLEALEDLDEIDNVCEIVSNNKDVLIVGEIRKEMNERLRIYNCFENEIVFNIPTDRERTEILVYLFELYNKQINTTEQNKTLLDVENVELELYGFLDSIAKLTPGFTASDLCILTRKAIIRATSNNKKLTKEINLEILNDMKIRSSIVAFEDIGGLSNIKKELFTSIIYPSLYSEKYKKFGIKNNSCVLLFGPPGCGKTLIAKAVSSMGHCNFISIRGPELISKYVGDSEKELRNLFEQAKQQQPCVIFFDEIDSICNKRGKTDFNDRIVNQILTLMDGFDDRENVYVIGVTNRVESIDEAFLRPGRFDKIIEISLPTAEERREIFTKHVKNINCEDFDFEELETAGFSGADISALVKDASLAFINENFHNEEDHIKKSYFINAAKNILKMKNIYQ